MFQEKLRNVTGGDVLQRPQHKSCANTSQVLHCAAQVLDNAPAHLVIPPDPLTISRNME